MWPFSLLLIRYWLSKGSFMYCHITFINIFLTTLYLVGLVRVNFYYIFFFFLYCLITIWYFFSHHYITYHMRGVFGAHVFVVKPPFNGKVLSGQSYRSGDFVFLVIVGTRNRVVVKLKTIEGQIVAI